MRTGFWLKTTMRRHIARPRCKYEDNIKNGNIGRRGVDCSHKAQDINQLRAFVNTLVNIRVPLMHEIFY
jgi:hypothetical protein